MNLTRQEAIRKFREHWRKLGEKGNASIGGARAYIARHKKEVVGYD